MNDGTEPQLLDVTSSTTSRFAAVVEFLFFNRQI